MNQKQKTGYKTSSESSEEWEKCNLLGSLLDTEHDIKRRKGQAMNAFRKKKKILKSNKISLSTRIRAFNAYVASIFLYNSELWTFTKNKERKIDTFQINLLRKIMNIKWSQIITNE